MSNSNPRNSRALADSMYASVKKDAEVSMEEVNIEEVREAIGLLLDISKGGRKNLASAPENKISKLLITYAKSELSQERYDAIGEECIAKMDIEKIDAIEEYLPLNMIIAMTGEGLAHKGVDVPKIMNLSYMGTVEFIDEIGAEEIAGMSGDELGTLFQEDPAERIASFKKQFNAISEKIKNGSLTMNTGVNVNIGDCEFEIHILESSDDCITFGLFFPGQEYSRRTVSFLNEGHAVLVKQPATRDGIGEMLEGMNFKGNRITLIPSDDMTDHEPDSSIVMKDRNTTSLVVEALLQ